MAKRKYELTEEEKEIEASRKRGEWTRGKMDDPLIKELSEATRANVERRAKEARINLRINPEDVSVAKALAAQDGLPYQTWLASQIHKIVTGQYVPRKLLDDVIQSIKGKKAS